MAEARVSSGKGNKRPRHRREARGSAEPPGALILAKKVCECGV